MAGNTLYDKLWDSHLVKQQDDGSCLIYIDRHLLHEVTSPQAFEGLRIAGRQPWRIETNLATPDHNVPTTSNERAIGVEGITDPVSKIQVMTLGDNCDEFGITEFKMQDERQGIVHVVGPEQGATLPGMTVVCGDSHTATHGALGALAHGIGTSEVEHVLATQCLIQKKSQNMLVRVDGVLGDGVTSKDVVLAIIGVIGTAGGTGYAIEFGGQVFEDMTMEGLHSDADAEFDHVVVLDGAGIAPQVTWGTSPEMVLPVFARVPNPAQEKDEVKASGMTRALEYMGLTAGQAITDIQLDRVFIGSCTNSRIEDLRAAAAVVEGHQVAKTLKQALVVPGSGLVKAQAEAEGLHTIFTNAGLEWREPGCSMCLAMNADKLGTGEHCASTSNRNFEGRQGFGGRTHLVSPAMAAAAAIAGHFVDVREFKGAL